MLDQIKAACEAATKAVQATETNTQFKTVFYVEKMGMKYTRILRSTDYGQGPVQPSAWCFVDVEGNLYKPAGYKAPAKNFTRGTLADLHNPAFAVDKQYGF